jgi:hypothetical protein
MRINTELQKTPASWLVAAVRRSLPAHIGSLPAHIGFRKYQVAPRLGAQAVRRRLLLRLYANLFSTTTIGTYGRNP